MRTKLKWASVIVTLINYKRNNMAQANLREVEDEQTTQDRARAAIQNYHAKPAKRIGLEPIPLRKGRHLDVDEVLARSLPKTIGQ